MEYAYPELDARKWKHPADYGGFSPDDDVVIAARTRDSGTLERSNYETIFSHLKETEENLASQHPADFERAYDANNGDLLIYDFRAAHWAVGWVEYMLMSQHAPDSLQQAVASVLSALDDYPVFDEDHWSELEYNEVSEYWEGLTVADRLELIQDNGGNIFAARHDYLSEAADPSGSLYDRLRS